MKYITTILAALFICTSCESYLDVHKDYIEDGERVYIRKIDSVVVNSGNMRAQVKLWYTNADQLTETVIYWNYRKDSIKINLSGLKKGKDSLFYTMPNLLESPYDFEIQNINSFGQRSLFTDAFGVVYGKEYTDGLKNRTIKNVGKNGGEFTIDWYLADEQMLFSEILIEDKTERVLKLDNSSTFDYPADGGFKYRSAFKPQAAAIDTFYTAWSETIKIE